MSPDWCRTGGRPFYIDRHGDFCCDRRIWRMNCVLTTRSMQFLGKKAEFSVFSICRFLHGSSTCYNSWAVFVQSTLIARFLSISSTLEIDGMAYFTLAMNARRLSRSYSVTAYSFLPLATLPLHLSHRSRWAMAAVKAICSYTQPFNSNHRHAIACWRVIWIQTWTRSGVKGYFSFKQTHFSSKHPWKKHPHHTDHVDAIGCTQEQDDQEKETYRWSFY